MEITLFRDPPLSIEHRHLPAEQYNLARVLQSRSPRGVAFVPIRSMQVLAILDADEFVFVDGRFMHLVVLAWQHFLPQERASLADAVPFEAAFHRVDAQEIQRRLQPELYSAMQALSGRGRIEGPARVLKFQRPPDPVSPGDNVLP